MERQPSQERFARLGIAAAPPPTDLKKVALSVLLATVLGAAFPRTAYRLRWVGRAGPKGVAASVAAGTLIRLGIDWFIRLVARGVLTRRAAEARLRQRLGRAPWPEELEEALREEYGL